MRFTPGPAQSLVSEIGPHVHEKNRLERTSMFSLYFDADKREYFIVVDEIRENAGGALATFTHRIMTVKEFERLHPDRGEIVHHAIRRNQEQKG